MTDQKLECPNCGRTESIEAISIFNATGFSRFEVRMDKDKRVHYTEVGKTEYDDGDEFETQLSCHRCDFQEHYDDSDIKELLEKQRKPDKSLKARNKAQEVKGE